MTGLFGDLIANRKGDPEVPKQVLAFLELYKLVAFDPSSKLGELAGKLLDAGTGFDVIADKLMDPGGSVDFSRGQLRLLHGEVARLLTLLPASRHDEVRRTLEDRGIIRELGQDEFEGPIKSALAKLGLPVRDRAAPPAQEW